MIVITLYVDAPAGQAIGIKEDIATFCEKYGDTQVFSIKEIAPKQMRLQGYDSPNQHKS